MLLALAGALVAGVLTTLAPCVLPLLPAVVGGSVAGGATSAGEQARRATGVAQGGVAVGTAVAAPPVTRHPGLRRALVVTASLGLSVIAFTLLLRATTALIGVPPQVWSYVSGGILVLLGLFMALPDAWEAVSGRLGLQQRAARRLAAARGTEGLGGAALTGAALGPVFTSCSPLYAYVVVTVLPAEPARGLAQLVAYVVGLCGTLLLVALAGQRVVRRLGWAVDSHGTFRRVLGLVFVVVGLGVALGLDRALQTWVIENSPIRPWELDSGFIPQ
jgi:cytochrome c biogenesis protein CcdA